MPDIRKGLFGTVMLIVAFCPFVAVAQALPPDYFRGKQITVIAGDASGSAYTKYAQLVQRRLGRHLPGSPTINIKLMPGADSLIAANYLMEVAPRDGTVIAALYRGLPTEPLLTGEDTHGKLDPRSLSWIASLNGEVSLAIAWHTAKVRSAGQLRERQLVVPIGGVAGDAAVFGALLNSFAGTRFKMICCYQGTAAQDLAMERGEIEGRLNFSWDNLKRMRKDWIDQKMVVPLLQFSTVAHPDLKDLPLATDLIERAEDRKIMEIALSRQSMGRPYAAPPGTPPAVLALLRQGFDQMLRDPEFLGDAEKASLEINAPMGGAQIEALIAQLYATDSGALERLRKAARP